MHTVVPTRPPPILTKFLCSLTKLVTHCPDCLLFGDFNCPKIDWQAYSAPPNTADSQLLDFATESLLHQCVHAPTRFRVNQVPSLLDLLFVKFANLTSPITIQPPLGKSDHALLQWTHTSAVPQPPPLPSKVSPARFNVQSLTSLALECNWEFPEKNSLNDLWISFRDQTSLPYIEGNPAAKNPKTLRA